VTPNGFLLHPAALTPDEQAELAAGVLTRVEAAPFYHARTPGGGQLTVAMTNLGPLGWVSDSSGYRFQAHHPVTLAPWPIMPPLLETLWRRFTGRSDAPDACLVNRYDATARMGLHQDKDEQDLSAPVLSISLGDTAIFRIGGPVRRSPTRSVRLASGDICVLADEARLAFHGVDRILPGSSRLIPGGGRINLTLRRAR
jgi:alkylated DNA repair protein (DNA oxidative demethylase)